MLMNHVMLKLESKTQWSRVKNYM